MSGTHLKGTMRSHEGWGPHNKKIYHFASALFSKYMLKIVKGFAPWILFDSFKEKFLYPLECREVPSGL